jgi:Icc-related predicted phosphoesterase
MADGGSRWPRRVAAVLLPVALGALGAVLLLGPSSALTGPVGPGEVELRAHWDLGHRTDLALPPLGRISADTHAGPVALTARVRELDIDAVRDLSAEQDPEARLVAEASTDLRSLALRFAIRATLIAAVIGAVAAALPPWRRRWHPLLGALGGTLAVGAILGGAALTYDPLAFAEPRYEGPVSAAPRIVEAVQRNIDDFDDVRSRVDVLGAQISELYADSVTESLQPSEDEVRILHVSDIHLNPVGLEVTAELAEQFDVDAVVDTGDLTSFGLPFESRIAGLIEDMPVPYLFVPGNHDSPANRRRIARFDGVTVLDPGAATVAGLRIAGIGHPSFTATNERDDDEVAADVDAQHDEVEELVAGADPDVLAVHDPHQADTVVGEVPVVMAGHIHEHRLEQVDGTVITTSGSTGATGLGSFTVDTDLPYDAEVLRFVDARLRSVDAVSLQGTNGDFRLDRVVLDLPPVADIDLGL